MVLKIYIFFYKYTGRGGVSYRIASSACTDDDDEVPRCDVFAPKSVSLEDIKGGKYNLVYAHPETLLNNRTISSILRTKMYRDKVCAIVIDEVHMVSEW